MNSNSFVVELDALKDRLLAPIVEAGQMSLQKNGDGNGSADAKKMLQAALANEIAVSELASGWMPGVREIDVKLAFARQAGDEAGHFDLVADRLKALSFDVDSFQPPDANPLIQYLRGLRGTVERVAAGLYALESLAYGVNENFMAFCESKGDAETVRIYENYIQPDEGRHHELGRLLLLKYAVDPSSQRKAHQAVAKVLEIAASTRSKAAQKIGAACFPGC